MPGWTPGAKLLRVDLKAAGIPYADTDGRVADFHSLRHTFLTNLANCGVHPSVAQRLARHSDINLTQTRYTHSALERLGEAVEKLPDFSVEAIPASEPEALRATGTDGRSVLAICLAKQGRLGATKPDQNRQERGIEPARREAPENGTGAVITPFDAAKKVARREGFEPPTVGLESCSAPG
jgi:hypothetical protein